MGDSMPNILTATTIPQANSHINMSKVLRQVRSALTTQNVKHIERDTDPEIDMLSVENITIVTTTPTRTWKEYYIANLLWLPYVILTCCFLLLLLISFIRFHFANKERYEIRNIRRQEQLEDQQRRDYQMYLKQLREAEMNANMPVYRDPNDPQDTNLLVLKKMNEYRKAMRKSSGFARQASGSGRTRAQATLHQKAQTNLNANSTRGVYAGTNMFLAMFSHRSPRNGPRPR